PRRSSDLRETLETRSGKFHDLAGEHTGRFAFASEVQDDILRGAGRAQVSSESNPDCRRDAACNLVVLPHARDFRVTHAVRQTIQRARRAGVRVGANDHLAGQGNFFAHDGMAYAGATTERGSVILDSGFGRDAFLTLTKIADAFKRLGRDRGKICGQSEVIRECVNGSRVFYFRPSS